MSQQFARIPTDAGAVAREVRGFGGVPWGRLFGYLRPHWRPFSIALVGLTTPERLRSGRDWRLREAARRSTH